MFVTGDAVPYAPSMRLTMTVYALYRQIYAACNPSRRRLNEGAMACRWRWWRWYTLASLPWGCRRPRSVPRGRLWGRDCMRHLPPSSGSPSLSPQGPCGLRWAASLGLGAQCGCWCGMHRGGIAWLLVHAVILAAAVLRRAIWRGLRPACARAQRIHSIALAECAYYLDARHDGRRCHGRSYDARLDHCERCRLEVGIPLHRPCATCAGHRVGECHEAVARRTDPHPARHIRHAGIWRA